MATVPQRELRNNTAALLRRVERGERLTITVHGHPVADLVPAERPRSFVPFVEIVDGLRGLLPADPGLEAELRDVMGADDAEDPFDRYEEVMRERRDQGAA
jgi:prevent-host-death family protein